MDWYPMRPDPAGERYIVIRSRDNRCWLVPFRGSGVGIRIYQPSTRSGRMLKRGLPLWKWALWIRRLPFSQLVPLSMEPELERCIRASVGEGMRCAAYYSAPGPMQKKVVQLSRGSRSAAYLKLSTDHRTGRLFEQEYQLLRRLQHSGMAGIPQALYYGQVQSHYAFIQSGYKKGAEREAEEFGPLQWAFLEQMYACTREEKPFEAAEYSRDLCRLERYLDRLDGQKAETLRRALELVRGFFGAQREFFLWHGDFTTWNMYEQNGKLFVFDFEYASFGYPKYFDYFHYELLKWIYSKKLSTEAIWKLLQELICSLADRFSLPGDEAALYCMGYILERFGRNKRFGEEFCMQVGEIETELWFDLLGRIEKNLHQ